MYFFDPLHPSQSAIIESLSKQSGLTMHELQESVHRNFGIKVSSPTLYRLVASLIENQVLIRKKGKYSLHLLWINHLLGMTADIEKIYSEKTQQTFDLPKKEGERKEYAADSLKGLDPAWNHILLQLVQETAKEEWYEYASHPWYTLGTPDTEVSLYTSICSKGTHVHMVHGNNTFLDTHGEKLLRNLLPEVSVSSVANPPFPKEGYLLIVSGPYILECILPEILSTHFALFFDTVKSVDQFDPQMFADVFCMKAKAKISIRKSSKEAETMRNTLRKLL